MESLQKYETMFDGTIGKYTGFDFTIDLLKEDAKHYHKKPSPIPNIHKTPLKKEVNRLIKNRSIKLN